MCVVLERHGEFSPCVCIRGKSGECGRWRDGAVAMGTPPFLRSHGLVRHSLTYLLVQRSLDNHYNTYREKQGWEWELIWDCWELVSWLPYGMCVTCGYCTCTNFLMWHAIFDFHHASVTVLISELGVSHFTCEWGLGYSLLLLLWARLVS